MRPTPQHLAMALGAALLASPAAWASGSVQHTGTVTAVDTARNTITVEEMGPWHPGKTNLKREVFELTPDTKVELARRGSVPGGYRGQWIEHPLPASDLRVGDYATVTVVREARRPEATQLVVVRPGATGSHDRGDRAGTKTHA
ncbi:MAG TPA: hypothetical protein VJX92_14725 [Methylomirabilota bacterium]|nr:hypothetical protein [Methylomirabilota bacterium]